MPTTITGSPVWVENLTIPSDTDLRAASAYNVPIQGLADRTKLLHELTVVSASISTPIAPAPLASDSWSSFLTVSGSNLVVRYSCGASKKWILFPFQPPDGATLNGFGVECQAGGTGSTFPTLTNRMAVGVFRRPLSANNGTWYPVGSLQYDQSPDYATYAALHYIIWTGSHVVQAQQYAYSFGMRSDDNTFGNYYGGTVYHDAPKLLA